MGQKYSTQVLNDSRYDVEKMSKIIQGHKPRFSETCVQLFENGKAVTKAMPLIVHECVYPECDKQVLYGGPLCSKHLKDVYGVRWGQTGLKDSDGSRFKFNGLFATRDFKSGENIIPYFCADHVMPQENFKVNNGMDPYDILIRGKNMSALRYRAASSLANSRMYNKIRKRPIDGQLYMVSDPDTNPAELDIDIIKCTKDISKKDEIFWYYGSQRREYMNHSYKDGNCEMLSNNPEIYQDVGRKRKRRNLDL